MNGRSRRRSGRLASTALALAAAAVLAGCSSQTARPAPAASGPGASGLPEVTLAVVPATGAAGAYIAYDNGFFKDVGLNVTIKPVTSSAAVLPDLVNGSVQFALGQWTSPLDAQSHRVAQLRAVAAGNDGGKGLEEIVAAPGSGITTLSQLKGQKIAVNVTQGLSEALTENVLASKGIAGSQVSWTAVPFQDMQTALAAHRVAAAFLTQPYLDAYLAAQKPGTVKVLADIDAGTTKDFPVTGYFTTAAWAKQNPLALAAFTLALERGQAIAASSQAEVAQAVARNTKISVRPGMALGTYPVSVTGAELEADLDRVARLMKDDGELPAKADPDALAKELAP